MSKFSDAPWYNKHDAYIYAPNAKRLVENKNTDGAVIAHMCVTDCFNGSMPDEELSANANLIAAAPEMYDELYETLQLLKGKSVYERDEFALAAKDIEELLARIDGEEDTK